ncbi:MAG TPA: glutamyl-tRNA reductase [Candidatus Tumulicola sp.]|jgi:glutamyl-tRNA reductase
MPIVCVGLSHRTAPVDVRERHAFPASRMGEALVALRDYPAVREAAMLQTCGRLEIYAELDDYEAGVAQIKSFLTNFGHGTTGYDIESYLYTLLGRQAVDHLFLVATGLDSMLIGEAEILGQVKDAYVQAQHAKSLGKTLHRLFRDALNAGKTARAQTGIGHESGSIATAAVDAAKRRFGSLEGKTIVVIGAGKMGAAAVKRLRLEGASRVIVTNRTVARAREVALEAGIGEAAELPRLGDALAAADLVVASTGASHFILNVARVSEAMTRRPNRPMFVVDIAVPRDADPAIAEIPNVALVDIDGLKSVVHEKLEVRRDAIPEVEEIVEECAVRFWQWYRSRAAVPAIATLTQRAEAVRMAELERLFARCPDLSEREKLLVTGMTMTIVSKLLHSVIVKLREKAATDRDQALSHARVLDELFELDLAEHLAQLVPRAIVADADQ